MIKGRPCKIVEVRHSKTGKHGHTRVRLTGMSLIAPFSKYELLQPGHVMLRQCNIHKAAYPVVSIRGEPKRAAPAAGSPGAKAAGVPAVAIAVKVEKDDEVDNDEEIKSDSSDGEEEAVRSEGEESEEDDEKKAAIIEVEVMDGKYPRTIRCGVEVDVKEALMDARAADAAAAEFAFMVTIVEAPIGNPNVKDGEDNDDDELENRATLLQWKKMDYAELIAATKPSGAKKR